jgi:hypothetical protein
MDDRMLRPNFIIDLGYMAAAIGFSGGDWL